MSRLRKVSEMVYDTLLNYPDTRSDDRQLIYTIYRNYFGIVNDRWTNVIFNRELPNFESIRRCRQKVQQDHEELRADSKVEQLRLDSQVDYLEFARDEDVWERWI